MQGGEKKKNKQQLFCTLVIIASETLSVYPFLSNKAVFKFMLHFNRDRLPTINQTSAFPQEKKVSKF